MTPAELAMVLASALLHAVWSASIKGSSGPLAFSLRQALLSLLVFPLLAPFLALPHVPPAVWALLTGTTLVHALYLYWMSRAYETTDLTVAYPIIRSTPAVLPFLAIPLLGERVSPVGGLGIGVVVAGVWLVHTRGDLRLAALLAPGTGFAYLTLLTTVGYSLLDKRGMALLEAAPWPGPLPRSVVFFFVLSAMHGVAFALLASLRIRPRTWRTALRGEWGAAGLSSLVSLGSYGLILEAYRTAPASYVVAVRQASVLFAVAIAAFWLRERPGRARVVGATATVAGVALIALFP